MMNPFIETFTPNSSRTKFNRRKHEDSYFSRVSNNTVQWINHQSPLEQFFYFLVLLILVVIFTAIYFIYTKHHVFHSEPLVMANSTPTSLELVVTTKKPKVLVYRTRSTTTPIPLGDNYHGHYNGHHPLIQVTTSATSDAEMVSSKETASMTKTTTEAQSTAVKTTSNKIIETSTSTTTSTTTTPSTIKKVEPSSTDSKKSEETNANEIPDSTAIYLIDTRDEFRELIKMKIDNLKDEAPSERDSREILKLAKQMRKRNGDSSLCEFMAFNHLSVPINFRDFYWFKRPMEFDNSTLLNPWDTFHPPCRNNCSGLSRSIQNKLNQFWDSCNSMNQNITDFKRLLNDLGFDKYLPMNKNESEVNNLLKSLNYRGLFNFKSIPGLNKTISLVDRDDLPFLELDEKKIHKFVVYLLDNQIPQLNGSLEKSKLETIKIALNEGLSLSESIQEINLSGINRINLSPKPFPRSSKSFLNIMNRNDFIELESGFVNGVLRTIEDHQPIDLYYYLVLTHLKKNLIHLRTESDLFTELIDPDFNSDEFCRNLVTLPFGLVLLKDHLIRTSSDDNDLVSSKLADYAINRMINMMANKLPPELIHELSFIIFERLAVNKIAFDGRHIDDLYDSLHITDNHFDNVQSVRSWLQSGYNEGCSINYATI